MEKTSIEKQFESQVRENERLLHKVCKIYAHTEVDREDLFQEIVIQLWKAYPRFKGESKFSTWLYRVALNTAISNIRKKKDFITSYDPETLPVQSGTDKNPEEEQIQELYKAIEHLNEVEKAIVMLYLEEKSYEEMEDILGINQGNLRVKMNRIKEKLRQRLKTSEHGT